MVSCFLRVLEYSVGYKPQPKLHSRSTVHSIGVDTLVFGRAGYTSQIRQTASAKQVLASTLEP